MYTTEQQTSTKQTRYPYKNTVKELWDEHVEGLGGQSREMPFEDFITSDRWQQINLEYALLAICQSCMRNRQKTESRQTLMSQCKLNQAVVDCDAEIPAKFHLLLAGKPTFP